MLDLQILLILLCMVAVAFFSGMETGVISIHRLRLRRFVKMGSLNARLLQSYLDHPDRLLGTTLVGTNLGVVVISVTSASIAEHKLGRLGEVALTAITALVILVFTEYLPKAWFHSQPLKRCSRFASALRAADLILRPFSQLVVWLTRLILPGQQESFSKRPPFVTKDDLKLLAQEGEKDGVLSPRERFMIHRVIELSGKRARQIMVPREDMKLVYTDTPLREFFDIARESNLRRMPVLDRETGEFTGIMNVFYALQALRKATDEPVCLFMRKPLFISENSPVDDILPRMRRFRQPMCLVRDANGQVSGLVTTEDVLVEIVGKL
jgi:putative hemolysin